MSLQNFFCKKGRGRAKKFLTISVLIAALLRKSNILAILFEFRAIFIIQ